MQKQSSPPPRVVCLTTWYPLVSNSSGIFVQSLSEAMANVGMEPQVLAARMESLRLLNRANFLAGVPVVRDQIGPPHASSICCWNLPFLNRFADKFNELALHYLFRRHLLKYGVPDIIHAHNGLLAGPAALRLSRETGLPFVVTEHSSIVGSRRLSPHQLQILREVYTAAAVVMPVSQTLAEDLRQLVAEGRYTVLPNLLPNLLFDKLSTGSSDEKVQVAMTSAAVPGKRIDVALKAISLLPASVRKRIRLVVAGGGPLLGALKNQASAVPEAEIRFMGPLQSSAVVNMLRQSDIFLHTSEFETFGVAVAEALAVGLPAVIGPCRGPSSFVDESNGVFLKRGDAPSFADAISKVVGDLEHWRGLRGAISRAAKSKFGEEVVTRQLREIYVAAIRQ